MIKNKSTKLDMNMLKLILALAWPTMLEQLLQTAVQYIDTAMVGSLGTQATSAVGSTATVNWLINSSVMALGVGFLSFIAKAIGAGDDTLARRTSAQVVTTVIALGVLLTVLTTSLSGLVPVLMQVEEGTRALASVYFFIIYLPMLPRCASMIFSIILRAAGDSKSPMKISLLMNIINIVLNFFLIYECRTVSLFGLDIFIPGAALGVVGAALASAISYTVGGIAITVVLFCHPKISPRGQRFRPEREILAPCMRVALPNMLQRFGTSFGYVAFASMINSLGDVATAAHTISNTVESAFYIPGYGMQTAAATLAGYAYGARDEERLSSVTRMFIPIEIILMIISGIGLFFLAPFLVGIFSTAPAVIALSVTVLRMVSFSEPFYGFSIIVEGFMQGVGRTKLPFLYNIICMWGVRIVGTFVVINFFSGGLVGAWACMIAHNLTLFCAYLFAYLRGLWNPFAKIKNQQKQEIIPEDEGATDLSDSASLK